MLSEFIVSSRRERDRSLLSVCLPAEQLSSTSEVQHLHAHAQGIDHATISIRSEHYNFARPRAEQDRIVAEIEKQFTRLDAATTALKRVQANLKRYRASVLKAACEGRLVPTEAELARKEGRDYEPADQLLQRILRERRARWEADTLAKMIASGKPPEDDRWKPQVQRASPPIRLSASAARRMVLGTR